MPRGLVFHVAALCLPTIAVVAISLAFFFLYLPRMVDDEPQRVDDASMRVVESLLKDRPSADIVWRKGIGIVKGDAGSFAVIPSPNGRWDEWDAAGKCPQRKLEKWGWFEIPPGRLVWVRDTAEGGNPDDVLMRSTDIAARDYRRLFGVYGGFSLLVLVGITFAGVRYLVGYATARDDFMSATAHDLTTPLVGMRYMIGKNDAEAKILNERMLRLVSNIKDFMRLGGKRKPPERSPCDLKKCFEEAYALFRDDYKSLLGGDVEVSGSASPALADETLVVQIIWNLLGNDLKYAAPYGRVSAVFADDGDRVRASFSDEGPGMSPKEMSRAFDRYYRAKTVLESGKGGFGIGLCTAREFAESMGGALSVRANVPRGCVFTLSLPRAPGLAPDGEAPSPET